MIRLAARTYAPRTIYTPAERLAARRIYGDVHAALAGAPAGVVMAEASRRFEAATGRSILGNTIRRLGYLPAPAAAGRRDDRAADPDPGPADGPADEPIPPVESDPTPDEIYRRAAEVRAARNPHARRLAESRDHGHGKADGSPEAAARRGRVRLSAAERRNMGWMVGGDVPDAFDFGFGAGEFEAGTGPHTWED